MARGAFRCKRSVKAGIAWFDRRRGAWKLRSALVVIEVTLALVLLGGAGLLARSFMQLAHVDPGFVAENATLLRLSLPQKEYGLPEQQTAFANDLIERLKNLPGVQAAGLTHAMPLQGDYVLGFNIEGRPPVDPADMPNTELLRGDAGLFSGHGDSTCPRTHLEVGAYRDRDGNLRLVIPFPTWDDLLRLAFDEILFCGATSVQVMRRMNALVKDVALAVPKERPPHD